MPLRSTTRRKPRGVALLMALAVVMLITLFVTEYFFAMGLELRAMTTYRESTRARDLARAVFQAVRQGLLLDEMEFFRGYRELQGLMEAGAALPWEDGLVLRLDIEPLDHHYNLNEMANLQEGSAQDIVRWEYFLRTLEDLDVPPEAEGFEPAPLDPQTIQGVYAGLWDWLDNDDIDYTEFPAANGAEASAYFAAEPEVTVKNGLLDRLSEVRLVKGVAESRIPWEAWQSRFAALPKGDGGTYFFPEKVNVNTASREEIADFLRRHRVENDLGSDNYRSIQNGINEYAERAEEIAERLVSEEVAEGGLFAQREAYTDASLKEALASIGFDDNYGVNYLFSLINEHYRIAVTTEFGGIQANLRAVVHVPRSEGNRTASGAPEVLWQTLE